MLTTLFYPCFPQLYAWVDPLSAVWPLRIYLPAAGRSRVGVDPRRDLVSSLIYENISSVNYFI